MAQTDTPPPIDDPLGDPTIHPDAYHGAVLLFRSNSVLY